MLEGMAPALAEVAAARFGGLLLYAPIVARGDIESAIAYLVRRLDENSGPDNFLTHSFSLHGRARRRGRRRRTGSGGPWRTGTGWCRPTRRVQDRAADPDRAGAGPGFANEPDTDFSIAANREWIARAPGGPMAPACGSTDPSWPAQTLAGVRRPRPASTRARGGAAGLPLAVGRRWTWWSGRWRAARAAGAELGRDDPRPTRRRRARGRRPTRWPGGEGELLAVMAFDAAKTVREGDPEVSEAIDFAAYYAAHIPATGDRLPAPRHRGGGLALELPPVDPGRRRARPPWRPGNAVIFKPAPETVAVAGELAEALWEGGVPRDRPAVRAVRGRRRQPSADHPPGRGRRGADRVVGHGPDVPGLAARIWRCTPRPAARTPWSSRPPPTSTRPSPTWCTRPSVTPARSARPPAWPSWRPRCTTTPASCAAWRTPCAACASARPGTWPRPWARSSGRRRARCSTPSPGWAPGERWLVPPRRLDDRGYLWSPGVKAGVQPGSPFHLTECFGPVLGDHAGRRPGRGHPLAEPARLRPDRRPARPRPGRDRPLAKARSRPATCTSTGAPPGPSCAGSRSAGWKRSVVGPGAKAGGPNYVASLGTWPAVTAGSDPGRATGRPAGQAWEDMRVPEDPTGLAAESQRLPLLPAARGWLCRGRRGH